VRCPQKEFYYHEVNNYNCRYDNHLGASVGGLRAIAYGDQRQGIGRLSLMQSCIVVSAVDGRSGRV
jgi:hypothetical protein